MESIIVPKEASRKEKYETLLPQLKALTAGEPDMIANISNIIGALKQGVNFFWIGIYFVKNEELVLGPFQGPVACTRISFGKGVCGKAWQEAETIIVADVNQFPGHIACNADSQSEIVVPVFKNDKVVAVLDVDSNSINDFDKVDAHYLKQVCELISAWL